MDAGYSVPVFYDSLIAKLVAWGADRDEAIARMSRALPEYQVLGIQTTIPFFVWLMRQPEYRRGSYDTTWLDRLLTERRGQTFNEFDDADETLADDRRCAGRLHARRRAGSERHRRTRQSLAAGRPRGGASRGWRSRSNIDGKTRKVSIESAGPDRYRVTVDGQPHVVQAVRAGEFGLSLILGGVDKDNGEPGLNRHVQVAPGGRGQVLVSMAGARRLVTVNGRRSSRAAADAGGHAHGAASVVAPMPGRVVRVLVNAGDVVAVRQAVVVVEAMKMENELRAPKAGKVRDMTATPGMLVEPGRLLMVIE